MTNHRYEKIKLPFNFFKFEISAGMYPAILFPFKISSSKLISSPNRIDRKPLRLFLEKFIALSDLRLKKSLGIEPDKKLSFITIVSISVFVKIVKQE